MGLFRKKRSGPFSGASTPGGSDSGVSELSDPATAALCAYLQEMVTVDTLVELVRKRDIGRIKFAIREANFYIDSRDEEGRTLLHHALLHNQTDIAHQLIQLGSDVNVKDESPRRETPLHIAVRRGQTEAVKMLLESPGFDLPRCDAYQLTKMIPATSAIDDLYTTPPPDSDSTLTKRRSFGDQYMLFVRQNTVEYIENNFPPGREGVREMLIIQDECVPPLEDLLHRIDYVHLNALYLVECKLNLEDSDHLKQLPLHTLVLSHNYLKKLPQSLFQIQTLEHLKVDRNQLAEIPSDIRNLRKLRTFCCDRQRPKLKSLPQSITKLDNLQVLSFSNNKIDNISWVIHLPRLKLLKCDHNRIQRLPSQLANLRELMVLDISHNRIEYIPSNLVDLIRRLYRFDYYNLTLKPRHIRNDKEQLVSHLELEQFLAQSPASRTKRDISVAVVGESHSGKSTLVEALKADKGICRTEVKQDSTFDIQQFELQSNDDKCYISAFVLANDVLDNFSRSIQVDLYLLVVDLTALELQNGSQHLFARHVNRLQMWLQALYEIAPNTPVLIVGTHAEMVKAMSFTDIWHIIENFLDQGRGHHIKHYSENRMSNCLLCSPRGSAVRQVLSKSRSGSAGFVDLGVPQTESMMNGHIPSGDSPPPDKFHFPHVVGYYEIDSKKHLPKDAKKSNMSVEQLKGAIVRITANPLDDGIPPSWLSFIRNMATINEQAPNHPCKPYDEVVSISRSFDIPPATVPYMLQYFHQRGKLVYFCGDETLSKLVVINPTWFIQVVSRIYDGYDASQCTLSEILEVLQDKELDRQLQKAGATISSAEWLLAAFQKLEICTPFIDSHTEKSYLLPNLLELGHPHPDVWPELPEWDEKQITYDCSINVLKPSQFGDFILRMNQEGRQLLEIVSDPAPVFLSHHVVFFTSVDVGGCDDCYSMRERLHRQLKCEVVQDDVLHKVHIHLQPRLDTVRITIRGITPCCIMKAVLDFIEMFLDDIDDEEDTSADCVSLASSHRSTGTNNTTGTPNSAHSQEEELERQRYLLCPKCVLMRHSRPEKISCQTMSPKRKAICSKWHNLGSWLRAITGDYRHSDHGPPGTLNLPDYEHPRLVMVLPPSLPVANKEWYLFSRMKFLEGFEVHFLCEYTGYWHMTDEPGFRLNQSPQFIGRVGNQLPAILNMALSMIQIVNGIHEHSQNGRMLAPVVADLIKLYDYLRSVDTHIQDPYTWLHKNKERVVNMLTKVLANANDGFPDLYFKVGNAISADAVFHSSSHSNRHDLARFLRIEVDSGRFGPLRPLYVGKEVRWLCDAHYEELRSMPSK